MKHYYRFIINYDEDETRIFISPKELKKGAVAVVHSYGEQFAIATVLEPVSELEALTGYQRKCLEDVICRKINDPCAIGKRLVEPQIDAVITLPHKKSICIGCCCIQADSCVHGF